MSQTVNSLMRILTRLTDFMLLNILWIVCSIPIITVGAATTAMYGVMLKIVKNEEGYITRDFLGIMKANFRNSTIIWLILLAVSVIIRADLSFMAGMPQGIRPIIQALLMLAMLLVTAVGIFSFGLQSRYENTVSQTLKNALLLTLGKFPLTIIMLIITAGSIALTLVSYETIVVGIVLWLVLGVSLVTWLNCIILRKVFDEIS